jgi:histidinol phosphatase-like PHP family hydrolase
MEHKFGHITVSVVKIKDPVQARKKNNKTSYMSTEHSKRKKYRAIISEEMEKMIWEEKKRGESSLARNRIKSALSKKGGDR